MRYPVFAKSKSSGGIMLFVSRDEAVIVRRRQLLPELALAFAPPQRSKLYQLLHKFIPRLMVC